MRNVSSSDLTGSAPRPADEKSPDEGRQLLAQAVADTVASRECGELSPNQTMTLSW